MENQRQPSSSNFGPRSRMSTRSKVVNGSWKERWSRFRSKRMKMIAKAMKKREAYMPRNMRNRNDGSNIDVTNNAHLHSGKKTNESDRKDQDGNIVYAQAKKVPPKDRRARQSLDMLPMNKTSIALMNGASKSKQQLSHISENSRHSPNSRLDDSLVPFTDIKASNPSRVKNVLPSRKQENPTPLLSKDGSNTRLGHKRQSHSVETQGVVHDSNISRSSHPIDSKVMTKESHNAKNGDAWTIEDNTLLSELNGQPIHTQGQNINVSKGTNKISKPLKCKRVLKGSNIPLASEDLVPNEYDSNEDMARQDKEMNVNETGMRSHICELHAMYEDNNKQEEIMKANATSNSSSALNFDELREEPMRNMEKISSSLFVKDLSRHQGYKSSCIEDNNRAITSSKDVIQSEFKTSRLELHKKDQPAAYVGKSNDVNSKRKVEPLLCMTRKRKRYIPSIEEDEDEEDEDGASGCNKNLMGVNILKGNVEQPCNYCSKPINEPTWSGIFKMDGKEYISLVGHLSTKSCEKVWKLSKSLPSVVEVERIARSVACPRIWKASEPRGDNIGLYLLPHNMRHDEELDQLVNEVKDDDLVLRAVINEAEMLIFPSTLLPKRYQTFQAKHYLWAVFKPREDKGVNLQNH